MMEKFPRGFQFKEKLNYQWKIENLLIVLLSKFG